MLKSILFTHDDLDGAGCRIVYELAHIGLKKGEDFDVINCGNNNVDELVKAALEREDYIGKDTEICFADIVCSRDLLNTLSRKFVAFQNNYKNIKIWDHHATNFPCQQEIPTAVIVPFNDMGVAEESGTSLIYKHYCNIAASKADDAEFCSPAFLSSKREGFLLSNLVNNIRAYDVYEWKRTNNMDAKKLQTLFFLLGMDNFCNRYINKIKENVYPADLFNPYDLEFINIKLENEQKVIDSITKDSVVDCEIRGYKAAFLMFPVGANISEVAYQFLQKYPEYDVFASFTLARGGEFSFRTQNEEINAGEVFAKPIGGGGHPKASGSPVPEYIIELLQDALLCHVTGNVFRAETWWEVPETNE